jgi:hypothetical protein
VKEIVTMRYLVCSLVIAGLAACGGGPVAGSSDQASDGASSGSDQIEAAIESAVSEMASGSLPDGFPFPIPDGVQVGFSEGDATTGRYAAMLSFPAERADEIADFYRTVFTDAGYAIEKDSPGPNGGAEISARKDDLLANANIYNQGGRGQGGVGVQRVVNP